MTTVSAQTARIVIDYGLKSGNALKTEQYNVSTKTKLNYSSTNINNVFQPISLREIFGVIGLSTQAEDGEIPQLVLDENGQIPIVAGGTGFYIQALLYDIDFTHQDSDEAFRKEMADYAAEYGAEALHEKLMVLLLMTLHIPRVREPLTIIKEAKILIIAIKVLISRNSQES